MAIDEDESPRRLLVRVGVLLSVLFIGSSLWLLASVVMLRDGVERGVDAITALTGLSSMTSKVLVMQVTSTDEVVAFGTSGARSFFFN